MITTRAPDGANKSCSKLATFDPNLQLISIVQYQEDDLVAYMTSSQINDTFLFHRVIKILTGGKILQISIAWCQIEAEIHSFPIMYGKGGGGDVVKIGEIEVSVQKLSLKQVFLRTQIWIISLQGGLS